MNLGCRCLGDAIRVNGRRAGAWVGAGIVLVLAAAGAPRSAGAAAVLVEADVIRLARERASAIALADAGERAAEARTRAAGLFPDPELHWVRETVESGPVADEDIASVSLPVDIVRPLAARSLAAAEGAWVRAEATLARSRAVHDALVAFHRVVIAEERVAIRARAVADLAEAARILARREEAGTASGYDSSRLSVAAELARSALAEARADRAAARSRLAILLAVDEASLDVEASLTLLSEEEATRLGEAPIPAQEAVAHAQESQEGADAAVSHARWAWVPVFELGGGLKHVDESGGGYGYVAGVSIRIPVFDRGQGLRAEAVAQRELTAVRADALRRELGAEVRSARAALRAARSELERFTAHTAGQVEALLTAVRSGYREGEHSILELVDAQRARTDVAERRLVLLEAAKAAEVRLRAAAGDLG